MKRVKGTLAEQLPKVEKKSNNTPTQKRVRRFCVTSYIDKEALERFVRRSAWIQHFALCTHDRDYQADGTPKQLHTHVILYTYNAHTSSGIRKNFDVFSAEYYSKLGLEPQNTLVQDCHSVVSQYRYLRHLDDLDKAPYEEQEVITDNDMYWKDLCRTNGMNDSSCNTGLAMFDDMLEGVSTREMIVRYGKEYIYHSHSFKECIKDHFKDSPRGIDEDMLSYEEFKQVSSDYLTSQNVIRQEDINTFYGVLEYLHSRFNLDLNIDIRGTYQQNTERRKNGALYNKIYE